MRTGPLLATAALLLALAGCVPTGTGGSASPTASATPVFASDAEALAAAEKAYAAYLTVSDQIANDGGKDPERLDGLAVGTLLSDDQDGFRSFVQKGWHSIGTTELTKTVLQSADLGAEVSSEGAVTVYLCEDVSRVDVVDVNGVSVVSAARPGQQQFQVTLDLVQSRLIPSEREPWTGSGICK